jgi:hypothetical protein
MATQTIHLSSADEGRVTWEADYDDVTMRVSALRVSNGSADGPRPAKCASRVWLNTDPTVQYPVDGSMLVTPPGVPGTPTVLSFGIAGGQAARWQLVVQNDRFNRPRIANLEGDFEFPYLG